MLKLLKPFLLSPIYYFNVPGPGAFITPEPEDNDLDDIIHQFSYGDCGVFAVALNKHYSYPIVGFFNGDELYHVAVAIDEYTFMDVQGVQTAMSIYTRYNDDLPSDPPEAVEMTLKDVHFYEPYTLDQLDDADQALALMIQYGKLPSITMTNNATIPTTEYNESQESFFQFDPLDFTVLMPHNESFEHSMLYGSDLVAVVASDERCSDIYTQMSAWLQSDIAKDEANNTDNPCAIMHIKHKGLNLVLAFDMGGSDNCGFKLIQSAPGLETLSRAHGYPEDIVSFVDEYLNTTLSASI